MEEKEVKKVPYEQLEGMVHQLSEQNRQLLAKLQETNTVLILKRLECLFKVVELSTKFEESFVQSCVNEIETLITLPEEKKTEE